MDFRRLAVFAVMDVLLLAALTTAIWWAHFEPAEISWRFCQVFLPTALVIVLAARLLLRRLPGPPEGAPLPPRREPDRKV